MAKDQELSGTGGRARKSRLSHKQLRSAVKKLHFKLLRQVNDTHIFAQQVITLLEEAKRKYAESPERADRKYYVPSVSSGKKAVKRTDEELRRVYDRFVKREFYENLIVAAVSHCESYLFDVVREIFRSYPEKINVNSKGMDHLDRDVPLKLLLEVGSLEEAIDQVIEARVVSISYASPRVYLSFLSHLIQVDTNDKAFSAYVEIKATRDLLVHGNGIVNGIYLDKSGSFARGKAGEEIRIDCDYFDHCIGALRRVSFLTNKGVESTFRR